MPSSKISQFKRSLASWLWRAFDEVVLFVGIATLAISLVYLAYLIFPGWQWYGSSQNGYDIITIIKAIGPVSIGIFVVCVLIAIARNKYGKTQ
jgi:hypothetical protein